jgi:pyruvate,water dikinase
MSLALLARAGLPVPPGFHITTAAYLHFVQENQLQPQIMKILQSLDLSNPLSFETASQQIGALFGHAQVSPDISEAISNSYAQLCTDSSLVHHPAQKPCLPSPGQFQLPVAVRSSATAEDLPGASFAGQQETYLNIRGVEAVLAAVKKCWASLWTARAIAYRARQGIDQGSVALAVVVQELVFAEAAGVLFTANPVSGRRSEMLLTAAWGLGEAIVSGAVTPDTLVLDKTSGQVVERQVADKQVMTVRTEDGAQEVPVPPLRRKKAAITRDQAAELARLGREIEALYAMPMDIEWARTAGEFAILQARPITALPEPPLEWPLPHPKAVLARGSFAEFVPEPISPLFATLAVPIARQATVQLMNKMGVSGDDSYLFSVINDYVYVGFVFTPRLTWQFTRGTLALTKQYLKTARQREAELHRAWLADLQALQVPQPAELSPCELLAAVRQAFTDTAQYYTVAQSGTIPLATMSELSFSRFYNSLVKRKDDPDSAIFVFGADNLALRSEKALFDLAAWAQQQPGLAEFLQRTPADAILPALQEKKEAELPAGVEFYARFSAYLEQYGHAIYDLDFARSLPAEDPAPMLEMLKVCLEGKNNPYERQRQALERREQAEADIIKRLDPLRRRWFLNLLHWAQETAPLREDSIARLGLSHPLMRSLLAELGRRLVEGGALANPHQVYDLEAQELQALAVSLERGEALPNMETVVQERQAKWQAMRHISPPSTLPEKSWMARFFPHNQPEGNIIKGFGASQGSITAPACVMIGPEDFARMRPGDVIVAGITTPAWTPLFARASAIVTDIGGPLSHSSIVAREYGIPAVLGTGSATRRIQDRQLITVDGSSGVVTLHAVGPGDGSNTAQPGPGTSLDWSPPDPKGIYMRGSVVDLLPDPVSPLFASLGIPGIIHGVFRAGSILTRSRPVLPGDYFTCINGYAYMNASFPARSWWWVIAHMLTSYPRMMRTMLPFWRDEVRPGYRAVVKRWQDHFSSPGATLSSAPVSELWQAAQEILDQAFYYVGTLMFATMGAAAGSEALLTKLYDRLVKRAGDPEAAALLMGYPTIPAQCDQSLYRLAQWCREHPRLAGFLLHTEGEEVFARLKDPAPAPVDPQEWQDFNQRLSQHLDQFGYLIYQLDFARPLPIDDPAPMLETLRMYLRGEGSDPLARQQASQALRIQLSAQALEHLHGLKRWAFIKSLDWAQSLAEVREDALADIGLGYPLLRQVLHELGQRLAASGILADGQDIFWLEKTEIETCMAALKTGAPLREFTDLVATRKAAWQAAKDVTPPPMIPFKKKYMGFNTNIWVPSSENSSGSMLKGVAASAGRVTAPARVLHGPQDFDQMQPGEILVATTTTPAWTPLFAMASGVVTDIGGPLSHGSIVAREYGVPAVMGTGVATRRLHSGQFITVDGSAGTVTIESLN